MSDDARRLAAVAQLTRAGYLAPGSHWTAELEGLRFHLSMPDRGRLLLDAEQELHFKRGPATWYHEDVGSKLADFRSFRGAFGPGSLQIVVDLLTGSAYADVDRAAAYEDVVNLAEHGVGEVLVPRVIGGLKRAWRLIRGQRVDA